MDPTLSSPAAAPPSHDPASPGIEKVRPDLPAPDTFPT